jgi:NAD(P)-dependent dehydrogenase (short-subunit alcohol dehydrogenase family)
MFDGLATLAHSLWVCIKTLLHSIEQVLMLPPRNPPLWPGRALRFMARAFVRGDAAAVHGVSRYSKADDIANAVAFLAHAKAQYITGSTLTVDGGANA